MRKKLARSILFFVFVFLIFIFFRFNNFDKRIGFGWDQEFFATQINQIVKNHKLTLIGPRVISDTGFFLGPYFYYLLAPFFLLTSSHPIALAIFVVIFNLIFFFAAFYAITKTFSMTHALFFLLMWSVNSYIILVEGTPWNPIFIPLGVILMWFILKKIDKENKDYLWILLGLTLGLFLNMHFQFAFMIIFPVAFLIPQLIKNHHKAKKILFLIFSFLIVFLPLFIFDLRHDFLNSKLILQFIAKGGIDNEKHYFLKWLPVFNNFIFPIINLNSNLFALLFYLVICFVAFFLFKRRSGFHKKFYLSFLILWLLFPIMFSIYGKRPSEYYFLFLYPFIYICLIDFLIIIKKPLIIAAIFILSIVSNRQAILGNYNDNMQGLYYKDRIVREIKKVTGKKEFDLAIQIEARNSEAGFKYLMDFYQLKYNIKPWYILTKEPLIKIIVPPTKDCQVKFGDFGLQVPKDF